MAIINKFHGGQQRRAGKTRALRSTRPPPPEISVAEGPVGRETLAAILLEARATDDLESDGVGSGDLESGDIESESPESRVPFDTMGYDERTPQKDVQIGNPEDQICPDDGDDGDEGGDGYADDDDDNDAPPEVEISEARPGFETLAVIDDELLREANRLAQEELAAQYETAEVLELFTFIILDTCLPVSASEEERREFVARRLWHRLPPGGIDTVRRIDIRPADETALMMRVWCAVHRIVQQQ